MSISEFMDIESGPNAARQQADRWLVHLRSSECGAVERMAFLRWREHPDHAAAYERAETLWNELGMLDGIEGMQTLRREALARGRHHTRSGRVLRYAAMVVLTIALTLSLGPGPSPRTHAVVAQTFASRAGSPRTVQLADGSSVILNVDSEVSVRLSDRLRAITLRRGEALFEVSPDPERPFVVDSGFGEIRALGTRFLVHRQAQLMTVTLLHGRIAVQGHTGSTGTIEEALMDQVGDRLRLFASGVVERDTVDPSSAESWTHGRLVFKATPLGLALDEVNRYSRRRIVVDDPWLSAVPISGSVRLGRGDSMANALAALLSLDVEHRADDQILLKAARR